jgi:hypothetical protein
MYLHLTYDLDFVAQNFLLFISFGVNYLSIWFRYLHGNVFLSLAVEGLRNGGSEDKAPFLFGVEFAVLVFPKAGTGRCSSLSLNYGPSRVLCNDPRIITSWIRSSGSCHRQESSVCTYM